MRLIQFFDRSGARKVGIVEDERICILNEVISIYELFYNKIDHDLNIENQIKLLASESFEDYPAILTENRILVPLDHPDPYHCWITGTGLTHLGSAASRDAMHKTLKSSEERNQTDSMKMFLMGMESGKMEGNNAASQPEWFYKGNGLMIVHPGQTLASPDFGLDGGEEAEIAGLYIINKEGKPYRVGFALGNEFSDHKMERINYLYLAHSKLRNCSYGPELLLGELPSHVVGQSRIYRNNELIWEKEFLSGENNMSHNIANLEYHHFKYQMFRQPGDVHIHYMGTSVLSFADGIKTENGDIFEIESEVFGKSLRNPLKI